MTKLHLIRLAIAVAVIGCAQPGSVVSRQTAELPAVEVRPSDRSRQELRRAVAYMMGVASVLIGSEELLQTSLLVMEKRRPLGPDGIQLSGRDYDKPEQFRLFKLDTACVLVKLRTGAREWLPNTQCIVEP